MYRVHAEQIERHVTAERQLSATYQAAGATEIELPVLAEALAQFDLALNSEPAQVSAKAAQLRRLGLVA